MNGLRVFVFLGAFLLFAMEPMVGRLLLPAFGGAFHVWTTSLMFFQGALFVAYLYAHLAAARLGRAHLAMLLVPVVLLPPTVRVAEGSGTASLLAELAIDFGLPFVAVATTGVVAQGWLARSSRPERERPYFLYSISNAGSLFALLAYALVIEPLMGLAAQRWAWTIGYVAYLVAALTAYRTTAPAPVIDMPQRSDAPRPDASRIAYWLVLSACPSVFLMAVTSLVALDAGNVPLVWAVPLAIYLATFVVAFREREGASGMAATAQRLWPHFAAVGLFFFAGAEAGGTWMQAALHLVVLFVVCLAAHAALYASRPAPQHLTLFYLVMSLGGWLGGAFVALVAPAWFSGLWEYPIALATLGVAMLLAHRRALMSWARGPGRAAIAITLLLVAAIAWRVASGSREDHGETRTLATRRSFYGIYFVLQRSTERGEVRDLVSGTTRHGRQLVDEVQRREPLSYYHRSGPLGDAMAVLRSRDEARPRRFGVVGLGVGAAAAYVEPGESIEFFEIDRAVIELARQHFTYLSDCRGEARTVVGDARLTLAAREGEPFDLLLIDAFAGDAIPTHLVTREAVELYRRALSEHGVLLFHISNRYYDLRPVLAATARALGMHAVIAERLAPSDRIAADPSVYLVMVRDEESLAPFVARGFERVTESWPEPVEPWTDDRASSLLALVPD